MGVVAALGFYFLEIYPVPDEIVLEHRHEEIEHIHFREHDVLHDQTEVREGKGSQQQHIHKPIPHKHRFVIDLHHKKWPS